MPVPTPALRHEAFPGVDSGSGARLDELLLSQRIFTRLTQLQESLQLEVSLIAVELSLP